MGPLLKDKVAVITGSGQGIGKAVAIAMAKHGAKVVTNNRRPATLGGDAETTAKEITDLGGEAIPFFGDISNFDVAEELVRPAVNSFGRIDILVNNAGVPSPRMIWEMTEEDWDKVIDVHLKGCFNCTRHASALMMRQRWGRILNATSGYRLGTSGQCNYCAAKAGIVGFTKGIAMELGSYGVTCNTYSPTVATRAGQAPGVAKRRKKMYEAGLMSKKRYDELTNALPPDIVAPLLVYLCTEAAAYINGQVFRIAGGDISLFQPEMEANTIHKDGGMWTIEELNDLMLKVIPKDTAAKTA